MRTCTYSLSAASLSRELVNAKFSTSRWIASRSLKLGDAKSSLGDAESSLGDAKSSLGDAKRLRGDV